VKQGHHCTGGWTSRAILVLQKNNTSMDFLLNFPSIFKKHSCGKIREGYTNVHKYFHILPPSSMLLWKMAALQTPMPTLNRHQSQKLQTPYLSWHFYPRYIIQSDYFLLFNVTWVSIQAKLSFILMVYTMDRQAVETLLPQQILGATCFRTNPFYCTGLVTPSLQVQ